MCLLAVIEAKDNNHSLGDGMLAALLAMLNCLTVPFVFSSNGDGFLFHNKLATDGIIEREISLEEFPSADLKRQWWSAHQ